MEMDSTMFKAGQVVRTDNGYTGTVTSVDENDGLVAVSWIRGSKMYEQWFYPHELEIMEQKQER